MQKLIFGIMLFAVAPVMAQGVAKDNFLKQQAYAEMQRVSGQIDVLQTNFEDLQRRLAKLENGHNESALRAEIESLKGTIAELKRELARQREEIVKDLSSRLAKIPASQPSAPVSKGDYEYTVQSGDSLYLIAQAFHTTVAKIKAMNNLKNDNLKIGQKLFLPKEK